MYYPYLVWSSGRGRTAGNSFEPIVVCHWHCIDIHVVVIECFTFFECVAPIRDIDMYIYIIPWTIIPIIYIPAIKFGNSIGHE